MGVTGVVPQRHVVERFSRSPGHLFGVFGLVLAGLVLVDVAVDWRQRVGVLIASVVLACATLIWMAVVRPLVVAYDDVLLLRNMARDVFVPWHLVDTATVADVLEVTAAGRTYRSIAVGRTQRDRLVRRLWQLAAANAHLSRGHHQAWQRWAAAELTLLAGSLAVATVTAVSG